MAREYKKNSGSRTKTPRAKSTKKKATRTRTAKRTKEPFYIDSRILPAAKINDRNEAANYLTAELFNVFQACMDLSGAEVPCHDFYELLFLDLVDLVEGLAGMMTDRQPIVLMGETGSSLPEIVDAMTGLKKQTKPSGVNYTSNEGIHGEVWPVTFDALTWLARAAVDGERRDARDRWSAEMKDREKATEMSIARERLDVKIRHLNGDPVRMSTLEWANRESQEKTAGGTA